MSDERLIEASIEIQELELKSKIANIQKNAQTYSLAPIGRCHNCGKHFSADEKNVESKRFCDKECKESWEDFFKAQKRKYGPNIMPMSAF